MAGCGNGLAIGLSPVEFIAGECFYCVDPVRLRFKVVFDEAGKVLCEQKVPSEPDDIVTLLTSVGVDYGRVGIEPGRSRSGW